ncbi:hypothetical protein J6590_066613 [Homalodisca vitripennis]|nr:hypothetical protein J6590_066613 [Homalodisca vitripennis]
MSGKLMTMMLMCSVLLFAYIGNSRSSEVAWRYCGRDLARALSTTCNSTFSKPLETVHTTISGKGETVSVTTRHIFRHKREVVTECCLNGCTVEQLRAYCE